MILRILVLCTGNSCRSQMAEGFLRKFGGKHVQVASAGLEPAGLNEYAVKVMSEIGVDISMQTSKHLEVFLGQAFDYVITVCDRVAARCPTFPGKTTRRHWPLDDPAGGSSEEEVLEQFRRLRDLIGRRVALWLEELKKKVCCLSPVGPIRCSLSRSL